MSFTFFEQLSIKRQSTTTPESPDNDSNIWQKLQEGRLLIDAYERADAIVIRAPMAGVTSDDIEISLHGDMLTIRGRRPEVTETGAQNFFYKECYWGSFSRTLILPTHVQASRIKALLKNGVLIVMLPKVLNSQHITLKTEDDFLT